MPEMRDGRIKPEVLAAITAALAFYGYSADKGYRIASARKMSDAWKKAGIIENMLAREMNSVLKGTVLGGSL
ncbi:hypothetical protein L9W92_00605 [Pelotomaculum terephthalicicum JT]|uniref:hypothetical protein n=1 Tax=Pelotomaculum TaxID=191373 RepID=UPI0009C85A75|nr:MULTISPECIES: hypothetical protein [Pelotomaculum]MCG9966558.1 hypothetical protein [Pelotomaculum terephthalicicum JT]OPX91231.1 MAG: hypothetical protein A4E54_00405 [Pelotomaculum sp. PtaB.Bin117]